MTAIRQVRRPAGRTGLVTQRCGRRAIVTVVAVLVSSPIALSGRAESPSAPAGGWQSRQEHQRRARVMARELVATVLESQLRQLADNGLEHSACYADIAAMRDHLDALVESEMAAASDLLAELPTLPPVEQARRYEELREKIRQIVLRLSSQRQAIVQRLKTAELSAQVRRLLALQTKVLDSTETLGVGQDGRLLATIHDQRDAGTLCRELARLLAAVGEWGGATGAAAAWGNRLLTSSDVTSRIDAAQAALESARFPEAATHQRAVVAALESLLARLEPAVTAVPVARSGLEHIGDLVARQQALRDKTRLAKADDRQTRALVLEQAAIQAEVRELAGARGHQPGAALLLQRAAESARETMTRLFAGRTQDAADAQGKVLASLALLQEELTDGDGAADAASSRDLGKRLTSLRQIAEAATGLEPQVADLAAADRPGRSADDAKTPAAALAELESRLPHGPLQTRVGLAREAVEEVTAAQREGAADSVKARAAVAAVERAVAEIKAEIADLERRQQAVLAGELSRAAEAVERAASAERRLAESGDVAGSDERRQAIRDTVDKVAESVRESRPAVAEALAGEVAENLAGAASRLRAEAAAAAAELARTAARQLDETTRASESVASALAAAASGTKPAPDSAAGWTEQARQAAALARQAAPLAPQAGASLRRAEQAAVELAQPEARQSRDRSGVVPRPTATPEDVRQGLEQAVESLAAREDRLRRDLAIAEGLQEATAQQERSRQELVKTGALLAAIERQDRDDEEGLPSAEPPSGPATDKGTKPKSASGKTSKQKGKGPSGTAQSSEKLDDAPPGQRNEPSGQRAADQTAEREDLAAEGDLERLTEEFAAAQRATGQGVIEVSGQREIADPALRAALDAASRLGTEPPRRTDQTVQAPQAAAMGTGFLPQSPEETAKMIAGLPPSGDQGGEAQPPGSESGPDEPQRSPGMANMSRVRSPPDAKGETDSLGGGIDEGGVTKGKGKGSSPKGEGHGQGPSTASSSKAERGESPPPSTGPDGPGAGQGGQQSGQPPPPPSLSQQPGGQGQGGQGQGPASGPPQGGAPPPPPTQAQAATAGGQGSGQGSGSGPSAGGGGPVARTGEAMPAAVGESGGASAAPPPGGTASAGSQPAPGPAGLAPTGPPVGPGQVATGRSGHDAAADRDVFRGDAWVARLPAELREAIRASARRPAPRSYEEKLRRYFNSID